MNIDNYKQEPSLGSIDSFEVNMKQIEQTNKLLAGIESKLTDFFRHNETPQQMNSVTFEGGDRNNTADFEEELKAGRFIMAEKDDFKLPTETHALSPIPEKVGLHGFLSQGSAESRPSHFINVIDQPRQQEYGQNYVPDFFSQGHNYRESAPFNPSIRDPKMDVQRFPTYSNVRSPTGYQFNLQDTNLLSGKNMYSEREKFDRIEDTLLGTGLKFNDTNTSGGIVEKMNKLEDFYNNKIRLLEDRLFNAEKQTQSLLKQNESLNIELTRLRRDQGESKNRYVDELNRALREQEDRIKREYEGNLKNKDRSAEENNKQMEKLLENMDDMKYERSRQNEELAHLKNLHQMTLDEKEQLHRQYQSLLNIHNQMLQMDIQKNEKSLKDSQSINSDYRNTHQRIEQDQMRQLVEALGSYKQELDYLKENNSLIQRQFTYEIQRLKEELRSQKDENKHLSEKLHVKESSRLLSPISPLSAKKAARDVETRPTGEFNNQDDLSRLDKHELANYARMVRDNFLELEEKHRQMLYSKTTTQNPLKDIGQKSREDLQQLNEAFSNVFEGESKSYNDISKHLSPRNNETSQIPSLDKRESMPFTNAQIKTTLLSTKEKKELLRETLEKDFSAVSGNDPHPKSSKSRSRVSTEKDEVSKDRRESKSKDGKENKRKKSFEDFTDELKRLKNIVNSKLTKKPSEAGSKTPRSSKTPTSGTTTGRGPVERKRSRSKSNNKKE